MMTPQAVVPILTSLYRRTSPPASVRLIYLFGSVARDSAHPGSDLDLGVLVREPNSTSALDAVGLLQRVGTEAALAVGIREEQVDVKELNGLGCYAMFRVVAEGRCLFEADARERANFEIRALTEYYDFQYYERIFRAALRRELLETRDGR